MTLDENASKRNSDEDPEGKTIDGEVTSTTKESSSDASSSGCGGASSQKRSFDEINTPEESNSPPNEGEKGDETSSSSGSTATPEQVVPEVAAVVEQSSSSSSSASPPKKPTEPSSSSSPATDTTELPEEEEEVVVGSTNKVEAAKAPEPVSFKVVFKKETYEMKLDLNDTIRTIKSAMYRHTGVTEDAQKLCYRGALQDTKTLKESGIKDGIKVLMVGSRVDEIIPVACPSTTRESPSSSTKETKEPLCQQKQHKKIIDKGVPEGVMTAWRNQEVPLPPEPLTGMLNKYGNKVRMTFKLELDEVWVSTKERTQKLQMSSIKSVISEPIEGHTEYHIMALQVGPTEASRIWFYWVPAQYVSAIRRAIQD